MDIINENGKRVFADWDLSSPIAVSPVSISYPFPNHLQFRKYEQSFAQLLSEYEPSKLGTKHDDFSNAVLVEESKTSHLGGGVVKFTKTFLDVPTITIIEPTTVNFTFPKMYEGNSTITTTDGEGVATTSENVLAKVRETYSKTVQAEVHWDYFDLSNSTNIDWGTNFGSIKIDDTVKHTPYPNITSEGKVVSLVSSYPIGSITIYDAEYDSEFHLSGLNRGVNWWLLSSEFEHVPITQKFSPIVSQTFDSSFDFTNPHNEQTETISGTEVSVAYVSTETTPSFESYLITINKEELLQVADSEIERFIGNVWRRKNIFTKAL
jgi:hypothetical protein